MQQELEAEYPNLPIQIVGINEWRHESGNTAATEGRNLPFLQDVDAADDDDFLSDVWASWDVTYRDVIVLDAQSEVVDVFNLTVNDLSDAARYDELKHILIDATTPDEPVTGDCNLDGDVTASDLACVVDIQQRDVVLEALDTVPGDLDGDGEVDFSDFLVFSGNFGKDLPSYSEGNINLSGGVDFEDFLLLARYFGSTSLAAAEPEEGSDAFSTDAIFADWDG